MMRIRTLSLVAGLLLSALLTGCMATDPSKYADKDLGTEQLSAEQRFRVAYTPSPIPPPINQLHTWTLQVTTPEGRAVENGTITVDGDMPEHKHGLPTRPQVTRYLGDGQYLVEGMKFQMGGWWVVDFAIEADGTADTVRFNLVLQ